jgi:sec-independent protein translocase protein TatA
MFDVGGGEIILILLAILLLFGPKKIPELSSMLGKGLRELRKAQSEFQSQLNEIKTEIDNTAKIDIQVAPNIIEHQKETVNREVLDLDRKTEEKNQTSSTLSIDTTK